MRRMGIATASLAVAAVAASGQARPDYSKVQIKATQLSENFYTLEGSGGTIGVLEGPDGVLMVDSEFPQLTEKIVAAIRKITKEPIRYLIDTHLHPDHTGGNENFAKLGVTIFARPELREGLMHPVTTGNGNKPDPSPAMALPRVTYDDPITFHMDGEEVDAIPIRNAHTDGDTMVHFVHDDIIMTGDFYRSLGYPDIDLPNHGSLKGMLEGLAYVIASSGPKTRIVPGHGAVVDRTAVAAHRDMILALRDRVDAMVAQGKTQQEVLAAKLTAPYDDKVPDAAATADRFIGQLYAEAKAGR